MSAERFDGAALGARIKVLRESRGMTLQQVSDASGITKSHVWELEQGKSQNPTVNAVWGLSAALCVSPANLLGLNDKMPPIDPVALKIAGIVDREIKRAVAAVTDISTVAATCPDCDGEGWTVGTDYEDHCCGGSDWECGASGCTGLISEPVQTQEACERCSGSGVVEGEAQ